MRVKYVRAGLAVADRRRARAQRRAEVELDVLAVERAREHVRVVVPVREREPEEPRLGDREQRAVDDRVVHRVDVVELEAEAGLADEAVDEAPPPRGAQIQRVDVRGAAQEVEVTDADRRAAPREQHALLRLHHRERERQLRDRREPADDRRAMDLPDRAIHREPAVGDARVALRRGVRGAADTLDLHPVDEHRAARAERRGAHAHVAVGDLLEWAPLDDVDRVAALDLLRRELLVLLDPHARRGDARARVAQEELAIERAKCGERARRREHHELATSTARATQNT